MMNIKNIEVEIRALLDDTLAFRNLIEKNGAKLIHSLYLCDIYFCKKTARKVEDVEMNEKGSYSLRLRKLRKGDNQDKFTINTKTITNYGDHNAWEEHEIEINDFSEAAKILELTEFKPFFKLEKNRFVYKLDDMEICVEDIVDFGGAVEIEIMCSDDQVVEAKKKIKEFLLKCDINETNIVPKSVTNIIMKERAFKQET
jgi:predicted adenylyl cyclase CyaB